MSKVIRNIINLVLHRGYGGDSPDLYIFKKSITFVPRCSGTFIKRSRNIRVLGIVASLSLLLITIATIFPIVRYQESAEAAFVPATTTLTMVSSKDTASVDITPVSSTGTFATSDASNQAEFTVSTDNLTGYSVSILGSDTSGQLVNADTGDTLDTIAIASPATTITENDFRTNTSYVNQWGYRLNVNSTTTTDFFAAPKSTTSAKEIYKTTAPNATGTSDSFSLALGAKIDYTKPIGTYTNTFILNAVANPITYKITYWDNTTKLSEEGQADITASKFTISQADPTKSGYIFRGWCYGTANYSANPTACTGTPAQVYHAGNDFIFSSIDPTTGIAEANLYAMWELPEIQNLDPAMCTSTPLTVVDSRDGEKYTVAELADGNCWLLENLRLDLTDSAVQANLTSTTTNATDAILDYLKNGGGTSPYPANGVIAKTASGKWTNDYANPYIATQYRDTTQAASGSAPAGKIGVYYNYCAASAGSYCYASDAASGNASYDICPAGWRMPTGGSSGEYKALYTAYSSNVANFESALSTPLSGWFASSSATPSRPGEHGVFWGSSTNNSMAADGSMHYLEVSGSTVEAGASGTRRAYGLSVRCVRGETRTISNITYMQDTITPAIIANTAIGATATLTDSRDGNTYTVAKLPDGNVWMTQNLRYVGDTGSASGSMVMKTATSNISANKTVSYTDLTKGDIYTAARIHNSGNNTNGVWYNYAAATAGTIATASNTTEATYDVCPKGWRLPTYEEQEGIKNYRSAYSPTNGGYYTGGSIEAQGNALWWSSTSSNTTQRYYLINNGSKLSTDYDGTRFDGYHVRCIKNNTMQEFTNQYTAEMTVGASVKLTDSRDKKQYTVTKLPDGNVWMTQNLRYVGDTGSASGSMVMKTATSNISANKTVSYTDLTAGDITTAARIHDSGDIANGAYYNYFAASAGTISGASNTTEATYDVCPKGWRLPTHNQQIAIANVLSGSASMFNPVKSGRYAGGSYDNNNQGIWWSSTPYEIDGRWALFYGSKLENYFDYRTVGASVRCIAK